jgi:hypothetical protein
LASSSLRATRTVIVLSLVASMLALGYFYTPDRLLSTRHMSPIFRHLLLADDARTAWLTLSVCVLAACWPYAAPIVKLVDVIGLHVAAVVVGAVVLLALGTLLVYHDTPFAMDEYAELFQAKVFAAGHLTASLPASVVDWLVPGGFNGAFLIASRHTGATIEVYWPGFSLLLGVFAALGVPWLCNPCLAGLALLLIHRITQDLTGERRAAAWALLFTLGAGAFAAYAISYYAMQARLTTNLLFVWLLLRPSRLRCAAAGAVGSLALIVHSPFPHALFAAPWIIGMARSAEHRKFLLPLLLGYLPLLLVVGVGWEHLRSTIAADNAADLNPVNILHGAMAIPDLGVLEIRIAALVKLWIWSVPCLIVLAVLGRMRFAADYRVRLLTQSAVLTLLGYVFVIFDQGHGWGNRYFHSAWGVLPILAGCAMAGRRPTEQRLVAFAGAAAVLNLLLVVPYQMRQIGDVIARHSAQLPAPRRPGGNVYFIHHGPGFYLPDLVQSDPLLRGADLFLYSRGPKLDAALRQQNWPDAMLIERAPGVEEWHLAARERLLPAYADAAASGDVAR